MNWKDVSGLPLGAVLRHDASFLMKLYDYVVPGTWGRGWETPDSTILMRSEPQLLWIVIDKKLDRKKLGETSRGVPCVLQLLSVYKDGSLVMGWVKDLDYLWRVEL